jgi:hypothetical protein
MDPAFFLSEANERARVDVARDATSGAAFKADGAWT